MYNRGYEPSVACYAADVTPDVATALFDAWDRVGAAFNPAEPRDPHTGRWIGHGGRLKKTDRDLKPLFPSGEGAAYRPSRLAWSQGGQHDYSKKQSHYITHDSANTYELIGDGKGWRLRVTSHEGKVLEDRPVKTKGEGQEIADKWGAPKEPVKEPPKAPEPSKEGEPPKLGVVSPGNPFALQLGDRVGFKGVGGSDEKGYLDRLDSFGLGVVTTDRGQTYHVPLDKMWRHSAPAAPSGVKLPPSMPVADPLRELLKGNPKTSHISIGYQGKVTAEQRKTVADSLNRLPSWVMATFAKNTDSVVVVEGKSLGKMGRGKERGADILGLWKPWIKQLSVAAGIKELPETTVHEALHSVDTGHLFSGSGEFADLNAELNRELGIRIGPHYRGVEPAARAEMFAELGAQYLLGHPYDLGFGNGRMPDVLKGKVDAVLRRLIGAPKAQAAKVAPVGEYGCATIQRADGSIDHVWIDRDGNEVDTPA